MYLRSLCLALFAMAVLPFAQQAAAQNLDLAFDFQTKYHYWFDDFDNFEADQWIITTTEAGAGSASEAVVDADGGILVLTNDAADNDLDFLQWSGDDAATALETYTFTAGYPLYFETRFKVSEATQLDFIMGLQVIDTTALAVSDGIWFQKDDGDTDLDFHVAASSTQTNATAVATVAADTYMTLAFHYPGSGNIDLYVNGSSVGTVAVTNAPSTELTVSFGVQNGEAVADLMSLDYILVAKCREAAICGVGL